MGYAFSDDKYMFYIENSMYALTVTLKDGKITGSIDDYSENDLKTLEIGKVEFTGLSSMFLDNF